MSMRRGSRASALAIRVAAIGALAIGALAMAPGAMASPNAELSIMDDQALLGGSQTNVDSTLARAKALGADRIRVSAFWSDIAPGATSQTKPSGFQAANPYDPAYDWTALDRVVASAGAHGLKVLVSISSPFPYWASEKPALKNPVWEPKPVEFAQFAYAVALRYRASVDEFALYNEPNQGAWLQPQSQGGKLVAPHLYRALVQAGYPAVKAAAPNAKVLVGELASSGRDDRGVTRPIRPLLFLREMSCRDSHYHAIHGGRCKGFRPVPIDALGHHPYSLFQSPYQRSLNRDDATLGDWRRLEQTLDRLQVKKALKTPTRRKIELDYTEFGYQTDPPDPFAGIPLARQSRWLQDALYVAWRTPRVGAINQFRLSDGRIRGKGPLAYREFQSGLWFANGKPKPSASTFPNPIVVRASGRSRLLIWGQIRVGGAHAVVVERRAPGSKAYKPVLRARTGALGWFQKRLARRLGSYRYRWSDAAGHGTSQAITVRR
jgi:hypothetical protein